MWIGDQYVRLLERQLGPMVGLNEHILR